MVSPGMPNMPNMQMVNFNNILNGKDSRWLQLEVCREFQRNKCTRPDTECKFAHPPVNVEVQNGRVTACYDSIKGRCNREKPPCKYFHPPQHLKDQLLINGRNHLALKNAFMTQIQGISPGTQLVHGTLPVQPSSPYLASIPTMANYNPYIASSPVMTMGMTEAVASPITGVVSQQVVPAQKLPRTDRLEAFPGMGVPYKRPAPDKTGLPVYQPTGNAAYQQALMQQLGAQSYVPVSCEYGNNTSSSSSSALLALPPPTADGSTHSPSSIHNASSSSAQAEAPSSSISLPASSSASITYSSPTFPSNTLSSTSLSGKANSLPHVSSVSPALSANVISYTGYALNKGGVRPPPKSTPANAFAAAQAAAAAAAAAVGTAPPPAVPTGLPSNFTPGSVTPSALGLGYGVGMPPPMGLGGFQMPGNVTMMAPQGMPGGIMQAPGMPMMQNVANVGPGGMPSSVFSPQLVYSQFPSSSMYLPQIPALSNNQQLSWAQAGEQPYKKLKTS